MELLNTLKRNILIELLVFTCVGSMCMTETVSKTKTHEKTSLGASDLQASVSHNPGLWNGLSYIVMEAYRVNIPNLDSESEVKSYSGYISVGQTQSRHLFFWYFPCTTTTQANTNKDAAGDYLNEHPKRSSSPPLVVWLNGGPGYSSLVGLFEEVGPLKVLDNGTVTLREVAWTKHYDMLFVDSLVDSGFSYSDDGQLTKSMKEAASDLHQLLTKFYHTFPHTKTRDLYIAGQSYSGKLATEFAAMVETDKSMKLTGVILASALFDPKMMLPMTPELMYQTGMLGWNEKSNMSQQIEALMDQLVIDADSNTTRAVLETIFGTLGTKLGGNTGSITYLTDPPAWTLDSYLNQTHVQKALHARPRPFVSFNEELIHPMAQDFPAGVQKPLIQLLDSGIKVLIFNGQMDASVSVAMTEAFLSKLEWSGIGQYKSCDRSEWTNEKGVVVGYVSQVHNLTRVVIRNSGHRTSIDQPTTTLDMVNKFISNQPIG